MKGLIAWIVGVTLTVSSVVTPAVIADETGEVHYWSSTGYLPADRTVVVQKPSGQMIAVAAPGPGMVMGSRIYLVNDDPAYDLSGAGDHWFLVGDGTAFQESNWRSQAAFVRTGSTVHEVVPISAEYRQDWLAVAAGDRPVRTFNAPRSTMDVSEMAMAPAGMAYVSNGNGADNDRYRFTKTQWAENGTKYRATKTKRKAYSAVKYRPARYTTTTRTVDQEPMVETQMAVAAVPEIEIRRDELGHELFQIHSSWYMKNNGDWFRAESWRGPFVRVKTGTVPREVRMSAEHESRIDMD
jgi:hypothetical protein